MASPLVTPVAAFRESATAFEGALAACAADCKSRQVHRLRTATRRLEAQLDLLGTLKGLPKHKRLARDLARRLKKLRRKAGAVRDIDVAHKLLEKHLPPDAMYSGQINQANETLNRSFSRRRERAAAKLEAFVGKKQKKIAAAVRRLISALEGAESFALTLDDLLLFVEERFRNDHAVGMRDPSPEQLHGIRKAAKAARYAAEMSKAPAASSAAERFQALQQSGGDWHDWHMLAATTTELLGEDHPIAGAFAHLCDRQLQLFRAEVEALRGAGGGDARTVDAVEEAEGA